MIQLSNYQHKINDKKKKKKKPNKKTTEKPVKPEKTKPEAESA